MSVEPIIGRQEEKAILTGFQVTRSRIRCRLRTASRRQDPLGQGILRGGDLFRNHWETWRHPKRAAGQLCPGPWQGDWNGNPTAKTLFVV